MSEKNINFNDKKIKKAPFIKTKYYTVLTTLMLIIYLFLKKNHMVIKIRLNTLLDIMIKTLLDDYV